MADKRNILVTGATGKQGRALIRALLAHPEYRILALTRSTKSPPAIRLLETAGGADADRITLVEANLDDADAVKRVFEGAEGGIWGVFAVLAYPGLGSDASGEEKQGKMLADLALEFQVQAYVYSSTIPPGPSEEYYLDASHKAKLHVEQHCRELGEQGLNWIFIRPGFFMENFDGFLGSIAVTLMRDNLKQGTTISLIASEDIGNVAAAVIRDHSRFLHKAVTATSERITMEQLADSYQRAVGSPIPAVPAFMGKALTTVNSAAQNVAKQVQIQYDAIKDGKLPEFESDVELAQSAYKMQTYYEWKLREKQRPQTQDRGWNKLSVFGLFTGRS